MTEENNNNIPIHKLRVYVYKKLQNKCPFCGSQTVTAKMKTKDGKLVDLNLRTCKKCNKRFATPSFYNSYEKNLISLNPDQTQMLIEERAAKIEARKQRKAEKAALKEAQKLDRKKGEEAKSKAIKKHILDSICQEWNDISDFDITGFSKSWVNKKFRNSVYDSLFVVFLVRDNKGKYRCIALSPIYKDIDDREHTFSILHASGEMAQELLESVKAKRTYFDYHNKHFEIVGAIALKENDLVKRVGRVNLRKLYSGKYERISEVVTERSFDYGSRECVFVYFRLTNTCVRYNHEIEAVTAKTTNAKNGESIEVNVFHCTNCDRYFINYEALQEYISRGIFPAFNYSMVRNANSNMKEASQLRLYGYTVREGALNGNERRSVLSWIIDSGLMTKAEIIKDLQFKVRYNGSKAGNERAKAKWQDDIQFVSQYVFDNKREIKAEFVPHK